MQMRKYNSTFSMILLKLKKGFLEYANGAGSALRN